jgi:hypothetical protein
VGGYYTAKLGYVEMIQADVGALSWWHQKLWKIRGPPKYIYFSGWC